MAVVEQNGDRAVVVICYDEVGAAIVVEVGGLYAVWALADLYYGGCELGIWRKRGIGRRRGAG